MSKKKANKPLKKNKPKQKAAKKTKKTTSKPAKKVKTAVKKAKPTAKPKTVAKPVETELAAKPPTEEPVKKYDHDVQVVNIVVSTSLEHDIPLEKMAAILSNTEYNPEQFPGLVIRIKEPKTSALIFSSGKVVCTGARSMQKVEESIQKIMETVIPRVKF